MDTMDVGQMVMRFFDAMQEHAEAQGSELEFDDVLVIAAYRLDDGVGVAYRSTTSRRHVNFGLLAECGELMRTSTEEGE